MFIDVSRSLEERSVMAKRTSRSKPDDATANETATAPKPLAPARSTRTPPADSEPVGAPAPPAAPDIDPTEDEIRHRAYARYLERGDGHGSAIDDWVHAEQELRKRR
jgi:hypothetical protein